VRSGDLFGATLDKVSKHLAKPEKLADKGEFASAVLQLANAIKVLGDTGDQGELKAALEGTARLPDLTAATRQERAETAA
jgi:hypothetical protein